MSFPAFGPGALALIPRFGEDVVAIFAQSDEGNDTQILQSANLMQVKVNEDVTSFTHPLENGRSRVDHRIINPVTIELQVILTNNLTLLTGLVGAGAFATSVADVYEQAREILLAGTVLSIQTRTNTYRNQLIDAMPHDETPKMFDGVIMNFRMKEIQFETANVTFAPRFDADQDTVQRGKQNPVELASEVASTVLIQAASIFGG